MIIKLLLIAATLAIAWYAVRHGGTGQQQALRRLVGCVVAAAGVLAVLWPDAVTWLANLVGVGRGTDLVLYGLVAVFGYVSVSLYNSVRRLEGEVTLLVRELALVPRDRDTTTTPHARVVGEPAAQDA